VRLLRFKDLGKPPLELVTTWQTINRWIEQEGFPRGRRIGRDRVWIEDEVLAWVANRPTGKAELRGRAKHLATGAKP
jgi:hypothetical protein